MVLTTVDEKKELMVSLKSSSNSSSMHKSEEKKSRLSQNIMAYFPPSQFKEKSPEINVLLQYQATDCLVENNSICQKIAKLKQPASPEEET